MGGAGRTDGVGGAGDGGTDGIRELRKMTQLLIPICRMRRKNLMISPNGRDKSVLI